MDHPWWIDIAVAVIVAVVPLLATAFSTKFLRKKQDEIKNQVQEVTLQIDGRLTELLNTARLLAHAQGIAEGRQAGVDDTAKVLSASQDDLARVTLAGRDADRADKG